MARSGGSAVSTGYDAVVVGAELAWLFGTVLQDAGSHPGPGVSMAPGRNAAETIFSDLGLDFRASVATGATRS
jgi:hypothetical protein